MKTLNIDELAEVYKVLIEKANSIVLIWDDKGIINHINDYGANFFGYERDELIGKPVMILVPDVDTKGKDLTFLAEDIIEHPDQYVTFLNENIKKNDERVWISWTNSVFVNKFGNKEVLTIGNDITELRITEDKLRIEGDKLRAILDNINVGVGVTDQYGNTLSLNNAALQIHGFEKESDMFRSFLKYIDAFELQYPNGKVMQVTDWPSSRAVKGEYVQDYEVKLIRKKTNTFRFINYSVIPILDRYGAVAYFIFNMVDVTESRLMENALKLKNRDLNRLNHELEKFNELLENLLYITAHDIKGPINNLKAIVDLFQSSQTEDARLKLIEQFSVNYIRLQKIISGLTEILKIQKIDKCHIQKIDLEKCLEGVLSGIKTLDKIDISITWDFTGKPSIYYVETYLTSVFRNLIENAIKYRKKDRPLKIHLESNKQGKYVLVTVQDNGIGIDLQKNKNDLFKPFKRFSRQAEGTGVGLYLINNMMSQNGGHIDVKSSQGKGATFYCYFVEYPKHIHQIKNF